MMLAFTIKKQNGEKKMKVDDGNLVEMTEEEFEPVHIDGKLIETKQELLDYMDYVHHTSEHKPLGEKFEDKPETDEQYITFFNDTEKTMKLHPGFRKDLVEKHPDGLAPKESIDVKPKEKGRTFIKIWERGNKCFLMID
ncbi:MAG: hypothetical protein U9M95_06470 [Candidatus Altiarchaeota archaeon]|nr:hypothetical protein [Candidatus Altiarchaeota archaeon]